MGITMTMTGRSGKPGRPSFFPIRAHLLTTSSSHAPYPSPRRKAAGLAHSAAPPLPTKQALRGPLFGGGIPPYSRAVRSARRIALSAESARQCRSVSLPSLSVRLSEGLRLVCPFAANRCPLFGQPATRLRKPATSSFIAAMDGCFPAPSIFFCRAKRNKTAPCRGRKDVIDYGDLSSGS